jgi:hypothetical protein
MVQAAKPGLGQGKGGGRPRREGEVVQVRLSLPGRVYRDLEGQANRGGLTMWEAVARLVEGGASGATSTCIQAEPGRGGISKAMVAAEALRLVKPHLGLCFVPDLVVSLLQQASLPEVHAALLDAVRARIIELRPESGMNRLSAAELALCPQGLRECRLSWARCL